MSSQVSEVGDTGVASETITDDDIEAFAGLSGDENPLHLNDQYADETMFNGRIAHGTLVEGIISAALADLDGVIVYLGKELSFKAPVRPGDTVTAEATITGRDDNIYTTDVIAITDDNTVVIEGTATIQINEEPDVESSDMTESVLHFDGACRGNPGPAATGYVLETTTETIEDGRPLEDHTNNEAEYKALLDGLETALSNGVTDITIKGDSQLIIRQVTGEYDCNADNLAPLLDDVRGRLAVFHSWSIEHVPREQNADADTAANNAIAD
jgi:ribonuclease HI